MLIILSTKINVDIAMLVLAVQSKLFIRVEFYDVFGARFVGKQSTGKQPFTPRMSKKLPSVSSICIFYRCMISIPTTRSAIYAFR